MVNNQDNLEYNDITPEDDQESQADLSFTEGRRDVLRRTFGRDETSSDEKDLVLNSDRGLEHHSLIKHSGHPNVPQADSGTGPSSLPSSGQEVNSSYS